MIFNAATGQPWRHFVLGSKQTSARVAGVGFVACTVGRRV